MGAALSLVPFTGAELLRRLEEQERLARLARWQHVDRRLARLARWQHVDGRPR